MMNAAIAATALAAFWVPDVYAVMFVATFVIPAAVAITVAGRAIVWLLTPNEWFPPQWRDSADSAAQANERLRAVNRPVHW